MFNEGANGRGRGQVLSAGGRGISQPNNADEVEQNKKFAIGFMLRKYSNIQIVENMLS